MIFCANCDSRVGVNGPCKVCAAVIHGQGCFQAAQSKARYGHRDWLVWNDADGSHAAPKTRKRLAAMLAPDVRSWTLISANDAVPMKGFPWLANNLIAQMEIGL